MSDLQGTWDAIGRSSGAASRAASLAEQALALHARHLRTEHGYSYARIAREMDTKVRTVRDWLGPL